jgi:hypothetical protein
LRKVTAAKGPRTCGSQLAGGSGHSLLFEQILCGVFHKNGDERHQMADGVEKVGVEVAVMV